MKGAIKHVEDHEEWAGIAADSDTGAYAIQGFMLHNWTKDKPVTEFNVASAAIAELASRKGWDARLCSHVGAMETYRAADPDAPVVSGRKAPGYVTGFRDAGGWWLCVPIDYLDQLDEPEHMSFEVSLKKRDVSLWAFEAYTKRHDPQSAIAEFSTTSEMALKDGTLYMYSDHPANERMLGLT